MATDPETGERGPRRVTDTIVGNGSAGFAEPRKSVIRMFGFSTTVRLPYVWPRFAGGPDGTPGNASRRRFRCPAVGRQRWWLLDL